MRLIDADVFEKQMYNEVFEKDSEYQKWDSGCWIRYKLFEKVLKEQPTITVESKPKQSVWVDGNGQEVKDRTGYCATCLACGEWSEYLTDFCPNCGADMRGDEK